MPDQIPTLSGAALNDLEELERQMEPFAGRLFRDAGGGVLLRSLHRDELIPLTNANSLLELIPREFKFQGERGAVMPSFAIASGLLGALKHTAQVELKRVVSCEHLLFNGEGWQQPGDYCAITQSIGIGRRATEHKTNTNCPHLRRVFSGVYTTPTERDRLMILACLMFGRVGMPDFPLILIDAKAKSSGKTRVASALRTITGGNSTGTINSIERLNQQLGEAALRPGPNVFLLDNLTRKIYSSHLSSAVHEENIHVEPKFKGLQPVFGPIFVLTANNTRLDTDLADKAVMVMLEAPAARGQRLSIMDPDPLGYAQQYRHQIVAEIRYILLNAKLPTIGDVIADEGFQTRFVQWERCAIAIAKAMGVKLSLGQELADSSDQVALELWAVYDQWETRDTAGKYASLIDLIRIAKENSGRLKALWYELTVRGTIASPQLCMNLARLVEQKLSKKILTIDGKCGTFEVVIDSQYQEPVAIQRRIT